MSDIKSDPPTLDAVVGCLKQLEPAKSIEQMDKAARMGFAEAYDRKRDMKSNEPSRQ